MLRIRAEKGEATPSWTEVVAGQVFSGLTEDTDYVLEFLGPECDIIVDDVPLQRFGFNTFRWRPCFYSGIVAVEVHVPGQVCRFVSSLHVGPSASKSNQAEFDAMVEEIREFDATWLSGDSAGTLEFGYSGRSGRFDTHVLLSRLRRFGPRFLDEMEKIVRSPHRSLVTDTQILPLARIRRVHTSALRDRNVISVVRGQPAVAVGVDSIRIKGMTSGATADTPANRAMFALLNRFRVTVATLGQELAARERAADDDVEKQRCKFRLGHLGELTTRVQQLLKSSLIRDVSKPETSSAGLTQIASQPTYSRAHRLGCRALRTQLEGREGEDHLQIPPSWGVYETWCFLSVVSSVASILGIEPNQREPDAVAAQSAVEFVLNDGRRLELLFQATFCSVDCRGARLGWSLSRERRPDIVLVLHEHSRIRTVVLDAKWRSGRSNVLDAMESAHIYHDALRVDNALVDACILLLPASIEIPELESDGFIRAHGVGCVGNVRPGAYGLPRLRKFIGRWLSSAAETSEVQQQTLRRLPSR